MIYEWKCKTCDFRAAVERSVTDSRVPPQNGEESQDMTRANLTPETDDIYTHHLAWYDEEVTGNHEPTWVRVFSASVPFQHLRQSGVFMDDNGNYAPRKV